MEGMFNESMLDPGVRQKLDERPGFCYDHTWQAIDLKLSDALGQAIPFQDLVKDALRKIEKNRQKSGSQLASALKPITAFPACSIEEATLECNIVTLAADLSNKVLHFQNACRKILQGELEAFIRKSDYRFRDEGFRKERDSYKRAAVIITGKRRPSEKKDLS